MTTYPKGLPNLNEDNVILFRDKKFVDFSANNIETAKLTSGSSLSWWTYLMIVIVIFAVVLFAHYIVKKINGTRFEERFVRHVKASVSTQVSKTHQDDDLKKKLELKLDKEGKVIRNSPGISLIFSKEQNKGKTSLMTSWPTEETWKNISKKSLSLFNSSETLQRPYTLQQMYNSDSDNMNNKNSATSQALQNNSTLESAISPPNLGLENPDDITQNEKNDKRNSFVIDDLENIYTNENQGTLTVNGATKYINNVGASSCGTAEDTAIYTEISNQKENETKASFEQFCETNFIETYRDSTEKHIDKFVALLNANKLSTKNDLEVQRTVEKIINFKPPVTILIPGQGISEKHQEIRTGSENDTSIKISINAEDIDDNDTEEISESKSFHGSSRSKESIKKSGSRVTFKHETMIPNVEPNATRSRTESLKSSRTHSKESILKSSATQSKESIKKQISRVTFVNGLKTPSCDSDSDTDDLPDAHFDVTKITDSMTRLSERTYSRENKIGNNMDDCFRKFPSKVFFSEPVVKNSRTDIFANKNILKRHEINDKIDTAWGPLKGLSEYLTDPTAMNKNSLEQHQSIQEASTSKSSNYEKYTPAKTETSENIINQKDQEVNETNTSDRTIRPDPSHEKFDSCQLDSDKFTQDNIEIDKKSTK